MTNNIAEPFIESISNDEALFILAPDYMIAIITALNERGPLSCADLVRETGAGRQTVANRLRRLEAEVIVRKWQRDKRSIIYELTMKGRATVAVLANLESV